MTTVATERPASPYDPALAPVERVAVAHQQAQADIRAAALAGIVALWATLDVDDLFGSWFGGLGDLIFAELSAAQELAAMEARDYVYWAVRAQDRAVDIPRLDPLAMAGRASDGRDLDTLLLAPVYRVYGARAAGASPEQALAAGEESLRRIVHTQVTDAGREADQLAVVAGDVVDVDDDVDLFSDRTAAEIIDEVLGPAAPPATAPRQRPAPVVQPTAPQSSAPPLPPAPPPRMTRQERREAVRARREAKLGWVRMLTPPSCSRCAVLAGKWYPWSAGFLRHPLCDCKHIPALENDSGDLTTDPALYFDSLSREDQDALFGQANAQAIRDGADVTQVVNASTRPGAMFTAGGRRYTREGTTRRGFFRGATAAGQRGVRRPTPLQIYRDADGDREVARAELVRFGYIIE